MPIDAIDNQENSFLLGAASYSGVSMTAQLMNTIGLVADIVGVCILFKFGFPQPDLDDSIKLTLEQTDSSTPARRKRYVVMSSLGLFFLVGGFALQIWATWM